MKAQKRLFVFCFIWLIVFSGNINLASQAESGKPQDVFKVGFIYPGASTDMGWDTAHDQARHYLETAMHGSVVTTCAESVPENAQAERVMERMVAQGNKIIFAVSYGYFEPAVRCATHHPDVHILLCGHLKPPTNLKNVAGYFAAYYEPLYIAGIVAARMTKTNNLGFIAGFPVCNLLWSINAFTLGARSINPKIKVHLVWTNSWCDPTLEAEASKALIEQKNDVLVSLLDSSLNVCKAAQQAKVFSIGTFYDLNQQAPDSWLTGECWNFGPLCTDIVKSIRNHTFKPDPHLHPLKEGYVKLASFGKNVPKEVQTEALAVAQQIKDGKIEIFKGPLKDREGKLRLAKGQAVTADWLDKMDWLIAGVEGTFPNK